MFVVTSKKSFTAPVVARMPADGGRTDVVKFNVIFKALSKPEVDRMWDGVQARAKANQDALASGGERNTTSDRELIDEVLIGFGEDLKDEDGSPLQFTPENVSKLCSIWPIEPAIVKSFFDNYINAPTKN